MASSAKDMVLLVGLVLVGGIAALLVLRPVATAGGAAAPGAGSGAGAGSGGGGAGGNTTAPPPPPPKTGVTNDPAVCDAEAQHARAIAERDLAQSELAKIEGPRFERALEDGCKQMLGLGLFVPIMGTINMSVCMQRARSYVIRGDRPEFEAIPALRELHTKYSALVTTYQNADTLVKRLSAQLTEMANAGRRCGASGNTKPPTNPPTTPTLKFRM